MYPSTEITSSFGKLVLEAVDRQCTYTIIESKAVPILSCTTPIGKGLCVWWGTATSKIPKINKLWWAG
jgi:hypothetical protein